MNVTVIITGLIILVIFVVPFYLVARSSKKKGTDSEQPSANAN